MFNEMRLDQQNYSAPSLAGVAILLEIGAEFGVLDIMRTCKRIHPVEAAHLTGFSESTLTQYFNALCCAGLLEKEDADGVCISYTPTRHLAKSIHDAGYLSWGLRACQPLIEHATEFATANSRAQYTYPRSGALVARASQWMGEQSFYPQSEAAILALRPKKIVDLGCGAGRLLIKCLEQLANATGTGIDLSATACEQANAAARAAGLRTRLAFIHSPIQALVDDPSPLVGAQAIHAGFVLHDLMPEEEQVLDSLLSSCRQAAPDAMLVVAEAIPFADNERERMFSAAFSYLHHSFMGRRLQTEEEWRARLRKAGYRSIGILQLGIPGGRLFTATSS